LGRLGLLGPSYEEILTYWWSKLVLKKMAGVDASLRLPDSMQGLTQESIKNAIDNNVEKKDGNTDPSSRTIDIRDRDMYIDHFFDVDQSNVQRAETLAQLGAMRYFKMSGCEVATFVIAAFIIAIGNSLLVWFSPCLGKSTCQG